MNKQEHTENFAKIWIKSMVVIVNIYLKRKRVVNRNVKHNSQKRKI